jgi:y4mF family transcriptional regulator
LIVYLLDATFVPKGTMMDTIADTKTLGTLVRTERKSQALTQEQLAGLAGVGVRFVRELEAGKESCQLGRALHVAQTLGLVVSISTRRENRP